MNAEIDKVLASEEAIFAQAVKAVVTADVPGLKELLDQRPDLVTNRARAAHRSTLLHYTAANGIEDELQLLFSKDIIRASFSKKKNLIFDLRERVD
ncbi:hypothetical protein IH879_18020 [candidate division KSB1 bacterium]|nr:hypothetical protein [candidate division KSB1 bacterium]